MAQDNHLKLKTIDKVSIAAGAMAITIGAFGLIGYNTDRLKRFSLERIAKVSKGSGVRKLDGSLNWGELDKNLDLYNNDQVFANDGKDIRVEMLDRGTELTVPIDSMVMISKDMGELTLNVERGGVLFKSKKKASFILKTKDGSTKKIQVEEDSHLKVLDTPERTFLKVIKGRADLVSNSGKADSISQDSFYQLDKKSQTTSTLQISELIEEQILDPVRKKDVTLIQGVEVSEVEVSSSPDFSNSRKLPVSQKKIDISDLAAGSYFVRSKLSPNKIDEITIAKAKAPTISLAMSGEQVEQGQPVSIKWDGREDLHYKVRIKQKSGEIASKIVKGNSFSYTPYESDKLEVLVTPLVKKKSVPVNQSSRLLSVRVLNRVKKKQTQSKEVKNIDKKDREDKSLIISTFLTEDKNVVYEQKLSKETNEVISSRAFENNKKIFEYSKQTTKNGSILKSNVYSSNSGRLKYTIKEEVQSTDRSDIKRELRSKVGPVSLVKNTLSYFEKPKVLEIRNRDKVIIKQEYSRVNSNISQLTLSKNELSTKGKSLDIKQAYDEQGKIQHHHWPVLETRCRYQHTLV